MKYTVKILDDAGNALQTLDVEAATLDKLTDAIKQVDLARDPQFSMQYVGNKSSNVESVGWFNETLYVKFKSGQSIYAYSNVKREVLDEALKADSIGRFIASKVVPNYTYKKI